MCIPQLSLCLNILLFIEQTYELKFVLLHFLEHIERVVSVPL